MAREGADLSVRPTLEASLAQVRISKVTVFTNNTMVVAYVNHATGGTLQEVVPADMGTTYAVHGVEVSPRSHIAGKENVEADYLSKGNLDPLSPRICDTVFKILGRPLISMPPPRTPGCIVLHNTVPPKG